MQHDRSGCIWFKTRYKSGLSLIWGKKMICVVQIVKVKVRVSAALLQQGKTDCAKFFKWHRGLFVGTTIFMWIEKVEVLHRKVRASIQTEKKKSKSFLNRELVVMRKRVGRDKDNTFSSSVKRPAVKGEATDEFIYLFLKWLEKSDEWTVTFKPDRVWQHK